MAIDGVDVLKPNAKTVTGSKLDIVGKYRDELDFLSASKNRIEEKARNTDMSDSERTAIEKSLSKIDQAIKDVEARIDRLSD